MKDRCTIERPTGAASTVDPETSDITVPKQTLVTEYPCRFRSYEPFESSPEVASKTTTVQRTAMRFPVSDDYLPKVGDIVTVTASPDPSLAAGSRVFRVADIPQNSLSTAFRVYVDEVTR